MASGEPGRRSLVRRALVLNFVFWTLFGALQASNWLFSPVAVIYPYPGRLIASAAFNALIWALLTPAIFRLATYVDPDRDDRLRRVAYIVGVGLVVGALVALLTGFAHRQLLPAPELSAPLPAPSRLWSMSRWYVQEVVTFFVVFVAGLASDMSRRYRARERDAARLQAEANQHETERAELRARTAQLQAQGAALHAQLAEARLAVLRTRLNPHFLFNTLNAVSALVARNPRGVRDMIALLSELLRYALQDSKEQEIPLGEELRLLRLYLEILEIRYQGQLKTSVTAGTDVLSALVPNLILQPLVENAMKHGIDRAGGYGAIEVVAERAGEVLTLSVRDTGPGNGSTAPEGESGMGLRLTRERLAELYGSDQCLTLEELASGGMLARIVVPYHTAADVRLAEDVAEP